MKSEMKPGNGVMVLFPFTVVLLLAACIAGGTGPEKPQTYRVTKGACGNVVFAEHIGTDSASAFAVVESRKAEEFGAGTVKLEAYVLEVVDRKGRVPEPAFYAIRVLDPETGTHVHSVHEVITTGGDLFHLQWCPD